VKRGDVTKPEEGKIKKADRDPPRFLTVDTIYHRNIISELEKLARQNGLESAAYSTGMTKIPILTN
jgi:hypothetical protein